MAHSQTYEAIILRTYDIGEADRFLILFTRERGRIAARATGVRKLTSRIGGHLLPFQHLSIDLHEGKSGFFVTAAMRKSEGKSPTFLEFWQIERGTEMCLALIEDEAPLPEVFDLLLRLMGSVEKDSPLLPFALSLLSVLGHLPDTDSIFFNPLKQDSRTHIEHMLKGNWEYMTEVSPFEQRKLLTLCEKTISSISNRTLLAGNIRTLAL